MAYQPRYIAYAKAHNKTPDEMMEYDKNYMFNFVSWIQKKIIEFQKVSPFLDKETFKWQKAFTEYLEDEYEEIKKEASNARRR